MSKRPIMRGTLLCCAVALCLVSAATAVRLPTRVGYDAKRHRQEQQSKQHSAHHAKVDVRAAFGAKEATANPQPDQVPLRSAETAEPTPFVNRTLFPQPYWLPYNLVIPNNANPGVNFAAAAPITFRPVAAAGVTVHAVVMSDTHLSVYAIPDADPDASVSVAIPSGTFDYVPIVALAPPLTGAGHNANVFFVATNMGVLALEYFPNNHTTAIARRHETFPNLLVQAQPVPGHPALLQVTSLNQTNDARVHIFDFETFLPRPAFNTTSGNVAKIALDSSPAVIMAPRCTEVACVVYDNVTSSLEFVSLATGLVTATVPVPAMDHRWNVTFVARGGTALIANQLHVTAVTFDAAGGAREAWTRRLGAADAPVAGVAPVGSTLAAVCVAGLSAAPGRVLFFSLSNDTAVFGYGSERFALDVPANTTLRGVTALPDVGRLLLDIASLPLSPRLPVASVVGAAQVFAATFDAATRELTAIGSRAWSSLAAESSASANIAPLSATYGVSLHSLDLGLDGPAAVRTRSAFAVYVTNVVTMQAFFMRATDGAVLATIHVPLPGPSLVDPVVPPTWWVPTVASRGGKGQIAVQLRASFPYLQITDLSVAPMITQFAPAGSATAIATTVDPTTGDVLRVASVPGPGMRSRLQRASAATGALTELDVELDIVLNNTAELVLWPQHGVALVYGSCWWEMGGYAQRGYLAFVDLRGRGRITYSRTSKDAAFALVYPFEKFPGVLVTDGADTSGFSLVDGAAGNVIAHSTLPPGTPLPTASIHAVGERDGEVMLVTGNGVMFLSTFNASLLMRYPVPDSVIVAAALTNNDTFTICTFADGNADNTLVTVNRQGTTVGIAITPTCIADLTWSNRNVFYTVVSQRSGFESMFRDYYLLRGEYNATAQMLTTGVVFLTRQVAGNSFQYMFDVFVDDELQVAVVTNMSPRAIFGVDLISGVEMWSLSADNGFSAVDTRFVTAPQPFGFQGSLFTTSATDVAANTLRLGCATNIVSGYPVYQLPLPSSFGPYGDVATFGITNGTAGVTLSTSDDVLGVVGFFPATSPVASTVARVPWFRNATGLPLFPAAGSNTLPPSPTNNPITLPPSFPLPGASPPSSFDMKWTYISIGIGVGLGAIGAVVRGCLRNSARRQTGANSETTPVMGTVVQNTDDAQQVLV